MTNLCSSHYNQHAIIDQMLTLLMLTQTWTWKLKILTQAFYFMFWIILGLILQFNTLFLWQNREYYFILFNRLFHFQKKNKLVMKIEANCKVMFEITKYITKYIMIKYWKSGLNTYILENFLYLNNLILFLLFILKI